ncbi:hypothetical protein KR074_010519, partial [Drosophila pseudoananassae]
IGGGSYGQVFKADWRNLRIAVKRLNYGVEAEVIDREINQLSKVRHQNIIELYGVSLHDDLYHLLVEYMDGGSLHSFLHADRRPSYTWSHSLNWALQMAQGIAHMHAMTPKAVVHRDVKPRNALLGNQGQVLKICDFGTVVDLTISMTVDVGTCRYKAPEVYKEHYTEKCDVYSWAISVWEILARKEPFLEFDTPFFLKEHVCENGRPNLEDITVPCSKDLLCLLKACWDMDLKNRFSMDFVVKALKEMVRDAGPMTPLENTV